MNLKYPYYADDSSLKLLTVTTKFHGREYKSNCIKIDDYYYVKNKDVFFVDGGWSLENDTYYDHEKKVKVKNKRSLLYGIVELPYDKEPVMGYFTPNAYNNCDVYIQRDKRCIFINADLLKNNKDYIEDISNGSYHRVKNYSNSELLLMKSRRVGVSHANNVYNIVDNMSQLHRMVHLHNDSDITIDKDIKYAANYIKDYTFGAELETINGALPNHLCNRYGIIICKDGSIRDVNGNYPPEYVTIPLSGAKGLQTLRNVAEEIQKRSDISNRCSLHLHIGGFKIDRLFMVALYKLCFSIQKDVFRMFPHYKNDEVKYAGKEKNYCKKLPNIMSSYKKGDFNLFTNSAYQDLYCFLTGGRKFDKDYNYEKKKNPWGGNKWDIKSRYYWVNFTNFVFGKQDTIEFRIHTATTNGDKIINWLMMCIAIIEYAQSNTKKCISGDPISFRDDVLKHYSQVRKTKYSSFLTQRLQDYYDFRVDYFKKDFDNANYLSPDEIIEDKNFIFNTLNIS